MRQFSFQMIPGYLRGWSSDQPLVLEKEYGTESLR
jgi:hypothetical protein